jgi:hypothetical protein
MVQGEIMSADAPVEGSTNSACRCMCEQQSVSSSVDIATKNAYLERTFEACIMNLFNAGYNNCIVSTQSGVPKGNQRQWTCSWYRGGQKFHTE